jgi:acyl-CoA dehydrogenase
MSTPNIACILPFVESPFAYLLQRTPPPAGGGPDSEAAPVGEPSDALERWWSRHLRWRSEIERPVDCAMIGGFCADRLGYAFASGYAEALRAMMPELDPSVRTAFCVSEQGGAHPRAIQTTLRETGGGELSIDGEKTYVTMGASACELLVGAAVGTGSDGRPQLKMVRVEASAPGVRFEALPATPFVPEIPHARVTLSAVRVSPDRVLSGDGYLAYIKPFRTVEDIHVHAALFGYLVGVGRRSGWPEADVARGLALLAALRTLAALPPSAPDTHVVLGAVIEESRTYLEATGPRWEAVDPDERARFERDRGLLSVAGNARRLRLEAAWRALS